MTLAVMLLEGVSMFQLGALAFFVWLAAARDRGWAWLPAAWFGFHVTRDLLGSGHQNSLLLPLLVVGAGVLMLSKERLSRSATVGILLFLIVVGIASTDRDGVEPPEPPPPAELAEAEFPELRGRILVIESEEAGIAIARSTTGSIAASSDDVEIAEEDDYVLVTLDEDPVEFQVPAESRVIVRSGSADVSVVVDAFTVSVDTLSGDIEAVLTGDHPVRAVTHNGSIEAKDVDDEDPDDHVLRASAGGTPVSLNSVSGDITIEQN